MTTIIVLLLILATICFIAGAVSTWQPKINLVALGLFFWVLTVLIPKLASLA